MKKLFVVGLLSMLLSGCSFLSTIENFTEILNSSKVNTSNTIITSSNIILEKPGSIKNKGLTGKEYLNYYSDAYNCKFFPSSGNPKMLVVPVLFKDSNLNNLLYSSNKILSDLNKTFNGNSEETGWESVSSYYQKSSYGKLNVEADILDDWIRLDKTYNELINLNQLQYLDPTWYVVDYVVESLNNQGIDLSQYDSNNDGFIDGIWLVYGENNYQSLKNPTDEEVQLLWAYTYWETNNEGVVGNPKANAYCWGSYDFMYESTSTKSPLIVDAHTFIHETGHMLGLDDYYDYDENSSLNPAGCLDMMDYNIGDHNAYSKFLLGWVEPQVFNYESGSYSLKPFESTGDCLVIPTSINNNLSPLEEYLIIEYYTPTGLNELDSIYQYNSIYPLMFTQNGVKIYHVDARVGRFKKNQNGKWYYDRYIRNYLKDDLYSATNKTTYFEVFASNTSSKSYNEDYKLLNLLSDNNIGNTKYYFNKTHAKNTDLFKRGSTLRGFQFNDGNALDFEIEITNINSDEALIFIE